MLILILGSLFYGTFRFPSCYSYFVTVTLTHLSVDKDGMAQLVFSDMDQVSITLNDN